MFSSDDSPEKATDEASPKRSKLVNGESDIDKKKKQGSPPKKVRRSVVISSEDEAEAEVKVLGPPLKKRKPVSTVRVLSKQCLGCVE